MSAFGGLALTSLGKNLQIKAQAGAQINYTKVSIGDGSLGNTSIEDLTNLKNKVKDLTITKLKVLPTGKAVIGTVLSNQTVTSGFYLREIGIFATDPDLGEILYCYGNAGATADYIPPNSGTDIIEKSMDFNILIGNATNVTATIDSSLVYASPSDVSSALTEAKTYTDSKINSSTVSEVKLTTTSSTNILTFTPSKQGNFKIDVYLRITGAANIAINISYTDATGVQNKNMMPEHNGLYFPCSSGAQPYTTGSYQLKHLFINAMAGAPININITSNIENRVYASALVMGV